MPHTSRELQAKLAVDEQSGHKLSAFEPAVSQSSLGFIEKLPQELSLLVLELLDLQSLFRLSQTSIGARHLVLDFRPCQEILEHTPTLPQTLAEARLLSRYSAHQIFRQVICSDRCSSCGLVGEYIFLLTCERVCLSCVLDKTSFQVIEKSLAESIFQLNSEKIAAAPAYYCAQRKLSFVRTDEMKEIAAMANAPTTLFAALGLDKLFIVYCSQRISSTIIFIPSPSEAWPEGGRQCGGCVKDIHLTLISHFDPRSPHLEFGEEILYKAMRRYSQAEFWDHIEHCRHAC
ncbi:hypothetical protein BBAD15_g5349 [Beauveria bassiana D1-5]|nr:hypothetical protein BBAD15_g5349 [Beauveria bassiana D1-5]